MCACVGGEGGIVSACARGSFAPGRKLKLVEGDVADRLAIAADISNEINDGLRLLECVRGKEAASRRVRRVLSPPHHLLLEELGVPATCT